MVNYRRVGISVAFGSILGVLCIVGVGSRIPGGYLGNMIYLIGMWYNRLIMGMLIGFVDDVVLIGEREDLGNSLVRGLIFGFLVSSAIFLSTEFRDLPSLFAGFAYGVIIDAVATRLTVTA